MQIVQLPPVCRTLLIPLAARAHAARLCPQLDVGDRYAAAGLALFEHGADEDWLEDRASVHAVLVRTAILRELAHAFFEQHPRSLGVNLGCGLSHYFQWLDTGRNRWIDADLPVVTALRADMPWPHHPRRHDRTVDLADEAHWWDTLGLPPTRNAAPVLMLAEGLLPYLQPEHATGLLRTFGERAPAGSTLIFDAVCALASGWAELHPAVGPTGAQFRWGPRALADLTAPHERLRLLSEHRVMESFGFPYAQTWPWFRWLTGVPFYEVYCLVAEGP
jgi:O-methyltransferase involved in polyketide biosynthesis